MIKITKKGVKIKTTSKQIDDEMMNLCIALVLTIGKEKTNNLLEKGLQMINPISYKDIVRKN